MNVYKIRVTGEVLETATATRRCNVDGHVLTFGREPVYLQAEDLPEALATDPYLRIDLVECAPPGTEVIDLKSERVQDPAVLVPPDAETDLKSERVQNPAAAVEPEPATSGRKRR